MMAALQTASSPARTLSATSQIPSALFMHLLNTAVVLMGFIGVTAPSAKHSIGKSILPDAWAPSTTGLDPVNSGKAFRAVPMVPGFFSGNSSSSSNNQMFAFATIDK